MREESVARRYAAAFLAVSEKQPGGIQAARDNMRLVADTIANNGQLNAVLHLPQVTSQRKQAILAEVLGNDVSKETINFLHLLSDKRRTDLIGDIAVELERLVRERQNIAQAKAITATPMLPAQVSALKASLEQRTGKTIELSTEVDPSLLGGVLVRIGDTVMDGSVRGKLDRLHEQLLTRK